MTTTMMMSKTMREKRGDDGEEDGDSFDDDDNNNDTYNNDEDVGCDKDSDYCRHNVLALDTLQRSLSHFILNAIHSHHSIKEFLFCFCLVVVVFVCLLLFFGGLYWNFNGVFNFERIYGAISPKLS